MRSCCFCKDFMFSRYSPQSGGHHKISNGQIIPTTDQRIPTESQKSPQTPTTDQSNGTTEKHSPNPPSALSQNETVNKKTKCTTKKPQAYLKFSSNTEVSVRPNKISTVLSAS